MGTFQNSTKAKPKHKPKPFTADDENKNFPFGFDFLFIKKEIFVLGFALTSVLFWKSRDCVSKRLREIERAFEQDNAQLLLLYLTYLCMCNLTSFVQHLCCCFFVFILPISCFFFFAFWESKNIVYLQTIHMYYGEKNVNQLQSYVNTGYNVFL